MRRIPAAARRARDGGRGKGAVGRAAPEDEPGDGPPEAVDEAGAEERSASGSKGSLARASDGDTVTFNHCFVGGGNIADKHGFQNFSEQFWDRQSATSGGASVAAVEEVFLTPASWGQCQYNFAMSN